MANRRMLAKSISISEQVNSLSDFAKLLFTWMIPHADDWGMIKGSPKVIKALVVPLTKQTAKDIESALAEMAAQNLIYWFENDGDQFIEFIKWDDHQSGLNKRTESKYMRFREIPGTSQNFSEIPGNSHLTELNLTEPNRREQNRTVASDPIQNFAEYVTMTNDEHEKLLATYGSEMTARMINILDNYKGATGKKYKSDYRAILNWVVKRCQEENKASPGRETAFDRSMKNVQRALIDKDDGGTCFD